MATVPFMVQIGTVELILANVELEIRTLKKALICKLFSLNDQNFSVAITKPIGDLGNFKPSLVYFRALIGVCVATDPSSTTT
jgi:hypothetical protein